MPFHCLRVVGDHAGEARTPQLFGAESAAITVLVERFRLAHRPSAVCAGTPEPSLVRVDDGVDGPDRRAAGRRVRLQRRGRCVGVTRPAGVVILRGPAVEIHAEGHDDSQHDRHRRDTGQHRRAATPPLGLVTAGVAQWMGVVVRRDWSEVGPAACCVPLGTCSPPADGCDS